MNSVRGNGTRSVLVAVLAAALSVQVAVAEPTHVTAQLRAARCCATDCSRGIARSCDCCHTRGGADGLGAVPPASNLGASVAGLVVSSVPVAAPASAPTLLHRSEAARVGPPLFLALRSLRR